VHGATNLKVGVTSNLRAKRTEKNELLYAELSHELCLAYSRQFALGLFVEFRARPLYIRP